MIAWRPWRTANSLDSRPCPSPPSKPRRHRRRDQRQQGVAGDMPHGVGFSPRPTQRPPVGLDRGDRSPTPRSIGHRQGRARTTSKGCGLRFFLCACGKAGGGGFSVPALWSNPPLKPVLLLWPRFAVSVWGSRRRVLLPTGADQGPTCRVHPSKPWPCSPRPAHTAPRSDRPASLPTPLRAPQRRRPH